MTNAGQALSFFDTGLQTPYMQRWNWTLQQILPGRFSLQLGYAGSRSTDFASPRTTTHPGSVPQYPAGAGPGHHQPPHQPG